MRNALVPLLLCLVLGLPAAARADDATQLSAAQRIDQAKAHFDRGQTLFGKAQFAAAALEFQAAYEFQPLALLLWNAAQAHRKAGEDALAIDYYKRYLDADPSTKKRAEVEKAVADLDFKQKVATAEPPTEAPGPARPQAGDTEPPPFSELQQQQQRADRVAARTAPRPWWKNPAAPALVGGGVVLAAIGGGLWGGANSTVRGANSNYGAFDAAHDVGGQRIGGVVLVSIGAAAAVAGGALYLMVWQRNKDHETHTRARHGAQASW